MQLYNYYYSAKNYYSVTEKPVKKLFTSKDGNLVVNTILQMELLGATYGIDAWLYRDDTNDELYDEMMWSCNNEEEMEACRSRYCKFDSYDDYFEELAEIAGSIGCERMKLKCLIKSLLLKYQRADKLLCFPYKEFDKLFFTLVESKNLDYLKVAEKLSRYHAERHSEYVSFGLLDEVRCKRRATERAIERERMGDE